jgi:hypothetical protein
VVGPCRPVEVDRVYCGASSIQQGPETPENFNVTTRRYIPEY